MEKFKNIYTNRDGDDITFTLEDDKTISFTGYSSTYIHIVEENNSPGFKKDNPNRKIIPISVDFIGGPFIFKGMDANDFLFNKKITDLSNNYLNQDFRRIVTNIDIQGPITYMTYEEKPFKKESNSIKKNSTKEAEY